MTIDDNKVANEFISDELKLLIERLPDRLQSSLFAQPELDTLIELVLDYGRLPEARFSSSNVVIGNQEITLEEIDSITAQLSSFGDDNRAGIARTLHRISAMRNRDGRIIGLTCRVGRAVQGMVRIIEDLISSGKSVLLLGPPGIGKTTMLREAARVLADDMNKRVIIVDTSNEIAGDGDVPHPSIGHARRMQVSASNKQHAVMIEAVENHMPQVVVIDEIGTELEAGAARTIAERGVQLIGTAHGTTLDNLMINPTLSDLIGGIQAVTLGDDEAKRRRTQKTVLERKSPPTFDIVVEIQDRYRVLVYTDTSNAVDERLRGRLPENELRWLEDGEVRVKKQEVSEPTGAREVTKGKFHPSAKHGPVLFLFGIDKHRLEVESKQMGLELSVTDDIRSATLMVTSKSYFRRKPQKVRDAESFGVPIYVLKTQTPVQMRQMLATMHPGASIENVVEHENENKEHLVLALREAEHAASEVINERENPVELNPQSAYIRRLQHLIAERNSIESKSVGREPNRRVKFYKGDN